MKVLKYKEFNESLILEEETDTASTVTYDTDFNDTPENYIRMDIRKIKNLLLSFFKNEEGEPDNETFGTLLSIEDDNFNTHQTLVLKYQDEQYMYNVYIKIPLSEALTKDSEKKLSMDSIKSCNIKFKKYDLSDSSLIGEIDRKIKISDINKQLLIDLNIELDKEFGNSNDDLDLEFKDETE